MSTNQDDDALGDEHPEWKRDNGWPVGVGPIVWMAGAGLFVVTIVLAWFLSVIF